MSNYNTIIALIITVSVLAGIGLLSLIVFFIFRYKKVICKEKQDNKPVTSSLDTHDVFFTILEYPTTTTTTNNNNNIHNNHNHNNQPNYNKKASTSRFLHLPEHDPISASLVRQSIEERAGYYKSPARTPVPYYKHTHYSSAINSNPILTEEDEETKEIQRWSASTYQVW